MPRTLRPAVLLARHGATTLNSETPGPEKIRGWLDVGLAEEGRRDAKELAQRIAVLPISRVISSDMSRARDTAQEIAQEAGKPLEITKALRDWWMGDYQGKLVSEAQPYLKKHQTELINAPTPRGESFASFLARFLPFLEQRMNEATQHPERGIIVLVTHGRVLRAAEAWLAGGMKHWDVNRELMTTEKKLWAKPGQALALIRHGQTWVQRVF